MERNIIYGRFMEGKTIREIGQFLNLRSGKIRGMEEKA